MSNRRPVIEKLITPGFGLCPTRPTSHIECKVLSPTGVINRNMGGIGLGIVAALESVSKAEFGCGNRMWSDPISVALGKGDKGCRLEDSYSFVTCNKPKKSVTNVRGKGCIFNISPARFGDEDMRMSQPAGFLESCHLCNKRLHGKDIYMYRGEKAFCSQECRSRQIAMDERPEKYCSSQVASSGASRVMATGIFAI